MSFLIRILGSSGKILRQVEAEYEFNPVRSKLDADDFPILGNLDPYGDTFFGGDECKALAEEVRRATDHLAGAGVSSEFITDLLRLCGLAGTTPRSRLVFSGD